MVSCNKLKITNQHGERLQTDVQKIQPSELHSNSQAHTATHPLKLTRVMGNVKHSTDSTELPPFQQL